MAKSIIARKFDLNTPRGGARPAASRVMALGVGQKLKEKVHSTTFIYRRCLVFNPQPQNQVFSTHEL
jgi:hypothetical protein